MDSLLTRRQSGFESLDGFRVVCAIWVHAFHAYAYTSIYGRMEDWMSKTLEEHIYLAPLWRGYLAVEGFLVLTGFLIAHPLFANLKTGKPLPSLATQLYRRTMRIVPVAFVTIFLCVAILQPLAALPISQIRSEVLQGRMKEWYPDTHKDLEYFPTGCEHGAWIFTIEMVNHLLPYGGCLGYTWTLALQFQVYLFIPLLFVAFGCRPRDTDSESKEQRRDDARRASRVAMAMLAIALLGAAMRLASLDHALRFNLRGTLGEAMSFWWYSSLWTRVPTVMAGCLAAYVYNFRQDWLERLRHSIVLRNACWLLLAVVIAVQSFLGPLLFDADALEVPGRSFIEFASRRLPSDMQPPVPFSRVPFAHMLLAGFRTAPLSLLTCFLFELGGPICAISWGLFLLGVLIRAGPFFRAVSSFLSLRFWYPLAQLSFISYMLHPAIFGLIMAFAPSLHPGDEGYTLRLFIAHAVLLIVPSFAAALVLYLLVQHPLDRWLRQGESSPNRLAWWFGVGYAAQLMVVSTILHITATYGFFQEPRDK